MMGIWLRADLRLIDNAAVSAALAQGRETGKPVVFIHDRRSTLGSIPLHPARVAFEKAEIAALAQQIRRGGFQLIPTGPTSSITKVVHEMGVQHLHSLQEWGDAESYACERKVRGALRALGVGLTDHPHSGILRGRAYDAYALERNPHRKAEMLPYFLRLPQMEGLAVPASLERLNAFLDETLPRGGYAANNWRADIGGSVSSRLSFDLACGSLAPERVLHEIHKRRAAAAQQGRTPHPALAAFQNRLSWRHNFVQSFETNLDAYPDPREAAQWRAEHKELIRSIPDYDQMPWTAHPYEERLARWRDGETGIPFIDASAKALAKTGWITFRQRQTFVSFAIDLLDLDWRDVLVETAKLFGDYTPGIHHPQLALQAGAAAPERGPRIVNPLKQSAELDPDGTFIRRYLPQLSAVPAPLVHKPWLNGGAEPIVDVERAMRAARAIWPLKHGLPPAGPRRSRSEDTAQASLF